MLSSFQTFINNIWFIIICQTVILVLVLFFQHEIKNTIRELISKFRTKDNYRQIFRFIPDHNKLDNKQLNLVDEILGAVSFFSRNKVGALLVFENTWSDKLYLSSGCLLDAVISTELLLNIFYPKSPLHDGAVIIRNKKLYAASVILPITENPRLNPWQYGTRHRAALGISEANKDCFCLVVSEESGDISIAESGKITKITKLDELKSFLYTWLLEQD